MPAFEELEQLLDGRGCRGAEHRVMHGLERAEHVVRVLGSLVRDLA